MKMCLQINGRVKSECDEQKYIIKNKCVKLLFAQNKIHMSEFLAFLVVWR